MDYRVGIIGCAGTGKSSVARALANELGIPFLASKSTTQPILERDGYDYSSGIQIERFLANTGRQNELLRITLEQQENLDSFVTDRTMVDLSAYALVEMNQSDPKAVRHILTTCEKHMADYTHLFVCPWRDVPVDPNKRRTLNSYYQYLIHTVEMGILHDWGCEFSELSHSDTDARLRDMKLILV